jgi:hypothetical protein
VRLHGEAIDHARHTPSFAEMQALEHRSSESWPRTARVGVDPSLPCEDVTCVLERGSALVAPLTRLLRRATRSSRH